MRRPHRVIRVATAADPAADPTVDARLEAAVAELLVTHRRTHPNPDVPLLRDAYAVAERAHRGQTRSSGEPFVTHPVAVTQILAELGMDPATLAAALLHDTVEDTEVSPEDLESTFGTEITMLVDGVTKLGKAGFDTRDAAEAETIRKLLAAGGRDLRVLVIKLADRLHNMRTLTALPPHKQRRIARFTQEVLVPLAARLAVYELKRELEDLAFRMLHPDQHASLTRQLDRLAADRDRFFDAVAAPLRADLHAARLKATVVCRPKHHYSIHQRVQRAPRPDRRLQPAETARLLVIVHSADQIDCYQALSVVHQRYASVPSRFADYIATPRFNLYQSLHTTVVTPGGDLVEVLVRTQEMHHAAEFGVAAHLQQPGTSPAATNLAWLRRLLDWQQDTGDPGEFMTGLRDELGAAELLLFTPRGDLVTLPAGATPVDFAYAIHTDIGHRCVSARVNQEFQPLDQPLADGDQVEILTSPATNPTPPHDWLRFVMTPRARTAIRRRLSDRDTLPTHTAAAPLPTSSQPASDQPTATPTASSPAPGVPSPAPTAASRAAASPDASLSPSPPPAAGTAPPPGTAPPLRTTTSPGTAPPPSVQEPRGPHAPRKPKAPRGLEAPRPRQGPQSAPGPRSAPGQRVGEPLPVPVVVPPAALAAGADRPPSAAGARLARCCTPLPPEPILGVRTRRGDVTVHRAACLNLRRNPHAQGRVHEVSWDADRTHPVPVAVQVNALDRVGLLHDVATTLADRDLCLLHANVVTEADRHARLQLTVEVTNHDELASLLDALHRVDAVYEVFRAGEPPTHPLQQVAETPPGIS